MSLLVGLVVAGLRYAPMEKQVRFAGAGGFELIGTLTVPARRGGRSVPAVLLLPGSGPTDRDGNLPPTIMTDLLKQIAASLALDGIATLRFDKRAAHIYISNFPKDRSQWANFFKWENFVGDATAAYRYLGSQPGIDPKRVGILGHSEGAEIAFQIGSNLANDPKKPAAIVTLGGAGRPMGPILHEQILRQLTNAKSPAPVVKMYMTYVDKAVEQIKKSGTFPASPPPGLDTLFNPTVTKLMQSYCLIDPAQLARNYPGPVLLINGERDSQVSALRDTPKLKEALEQRKAGSVEVMIVPNASHNLKSTLHGSDDAFAGPVEPSVLAKLKQFLTAELHP